MGDQELVRFRVREYLENAVKNLSAAREAPNAPRLTGEIRKIRRRIKHLIPRAWKQGCVDFWPDFELLYEYYPFLTRAYRLWLELRG